MEKIYLKKETIPFSGPSASVKSTLECGSRKIACCGVVVEKPSHKEFGSIEMNILAIRNPTKIPAKRGVRFLRLVIFLTPKCIMTEIEFLQKKLDFIADSYHSFHLWNP